MRLVEISNYLDSGLALVPIPLGHKGPVNPGWNSPQSVIISSANANQLAMNVGLAHLYCRPSPTAAIDIDFLPDAIKWCSSKGINLSELLKAPNAVVIHSGKRYSLKLIYRLPEGCPGLESVKVCGVNRPTALEFRCATKNGLTVQDLLPPSLHPSGERYEFIGAGSILAIPTIPENLLQVWMQILTERNVPRSQRLKAPSPGYCAPESPRNIAQVQEALSKISARCSYERWRNVVWALLSTSWGCAERLAETWSRTAPELFDNNAFCLIVNSYDSSRDDAITLGTLYHYAKQEA